MNRFIDADGSLHLGVVSASHNEVLTAVYADLGEVLRAFLRKDVGDELRAEGYMDHTGLLDAIREGDPEAASREAASHTAEWGHGLEL